MQHVYTGHTERSVESIPVLEGQALRYVGLEDLEKLPLAYGFDGLLKAFYHTWSVPECKENPSA